MFTGLVEGRGRVASLASTGPAIELAICPPPEMTSERIAIGDSVALSGCCLTIVAATDERWVFQAGAETLAKTSLGRLAVGDAVNLERALPVTGRLGGHFVQGHVDGTGAVAELRPDADWTTMWFRASESLTRQMVPKGSVAVDGVSLTLVEVDRERFSVALIPHTLQVTTLGLRDVGDVVNIETDILGKYVIKFLGEWRSGRVVECSSGE